MKNGVALTVLKEVQGEVHRSRALQFKFSGFDCEEFGAAQNATRGRLKVDEKLLLETSKFRFGTAGSCCQK